MAEDKSPKGNVNPEFNNATTGLNQDNTLNQAKKGSLTYALNAAVENFDSESVNYQNEPGNTPCVQFPDGYVLVGKHFIPEKNKQIYFLADPVNGYSQIGYMENNDCQYRVRACSSCLNFDVNHPIHRVAHKVTNFGTEIYWPDNNGRRYLNIDDIPRPLRDGSSLCDPIYDDADCAIDCEKLKLQPNFTIPLLRVTNALSGGEILAGTVQFAAQYSDAIGNPYTSYYGVTNPTPIADIQLATVNFNYPVGKSIVVDIQNLDVTGQFQYFNLAVLKTVNAITTPELVGTYFIDRDNKQITYTGQNQTQIQLAIEDIFEKFPYYDGADYVTHVQDILVWKGMTASKRLNYQSIASKVNVLWETHRIPAGEDYSDEVLATNYRSYMRDEVYALEMAFLLTNGKETDGFHIPGRLKNAFEIGATPIYPTNPDFVGNEDTGEDYASYWKIYNTATVEGTSSQYDSLDDNYKGPYQYGTMAYWESSEEYPCNEDIWGDLAGEKIRHHKFPDNLVSPIFETDPFPGVSNLVREDKAIFPIGIRIESIDIQTLINDSDLTEEQKSEIVGYKILRGDRGVNKSIIAKGMLRNVNKYSREDQNFYYPNYPYNDTNVDPFINSVNNAWTAETDPFEITVYELPDTNPNTGLPCLTVDYVDPNTNKDKTIYYEELGVQPILCSIGKPIIKSVGQVNKVWYGRGSLGDYKNNFLGTTPDTATVKVDPENIGTVSWAEYDTIVVYIQSGFQRKFLWECEDPIAGTESYANYWTGKGQTWTIRAKVGAVPVCIDGECSNMRYQVIEAGKKRLDVCGEETPITTIEEQGQEVLYRQIFNSPDTSFGQPFLGNILKLENVIYGAGSAHFVEVKNNAKYRLLTEEAQRDALLSSEKLGQISTSFNAGAMFTAYQAYLQIYINGITRKNYAYSFNSIASYNYSSPIANDQGIKQRELDIKRYLIPGVQNVGEVDININNYNRETSVYLRTIGSVNETTTAFSLPHKSPDFLNASGGMTETSRYTIFEKSLCATPSKEQPIQVVSYYGSLKNTFINQWGQIYSYDTIDTGHTVIFGKESLSPSTVFGGDTFIGRFAYKTKVPFFIDNRVGAPDDSDIFYDEIGNIAYPKYWHSARSILSTYNGSDAGIMRNIVSTKAHNFDCPNDQGGELDPATDPADYPDRTFYDGYMYLFAYGVPSFYCESSYNLDLRQAFNNREGEFWPHVSSGIPDDWVQEDNVSILNDNTYNYNVTYSKQNKESAITHLPEDWTIDYKNTNYPFRAVYSDIQITDADNRINNWLTYRALSYFDFPQNFGALTALDGLANKAILARFENKSLLYNALVTIDTSNPQAAYIGNPRLFSNQPIDYADTDLGYIGSQHKMLLKIPQGAVFADAKRGQIFLVNGTEATDLTAFGSGMNRFFTDHLTFKILKHFPPQVIDGVTYELNIDNNFNGIGLHGVYDSKYERIIITKLDYIPLYNTISYDPIENKFYNTTDRKREVFLSDQEFFCNKSYTISFNFNTKSWISFHSYLPNWYIGENNYFYSGVNYCPNDFDVLVGVMLPNFTTTTTSTTRYIVPTTTTSTTLYIPDCDIVVQVTVPSCDIDGNAIIIYTPEVCQRPASGMTSFTLINGYTLVTPATAIDSTTDYVAACINSGYYAAFNGDGNYEETSIFVEALSYGLGSTIYVVDGTTDCNFPIDGWYFTAESALASGDPSLDYMIYRLDNGVIVEEFDCSSNISTTTTTSSTTTAPPGTTICVTGIYTNPDPAHPLGGVITYTGVDLLEHTVGNIWDDDFITLVVLGITSVTGAIVTAGACP
jgi:hypothetical protein